MSFEIKKRDLMGRIGTLETKNGIMETPLLFPVVNPGIQTISPKELGDKFNCDAIITNAYIINKNFKKIAIENGLHNFLNFNGSIMTDSGAYQLLIYKDIEITPREIIHFQEIIDTDIATILDLPTGWNVPREYALYTVKETIKRAKTMQKIKSREDIAWVGPIQGGQYLDLIAKSAKEMGKLPFQIHALGSPTPVMEQYKFDVLVDMIMAAKNHLPADRPLHLFGAGHPFMFSLAVALGCDLFDSAAYALYAREGRYLTNSGTLRIEEMDYLPCSCPVCNKNDPQTINNLPKEHKQKLLSEHNLHVSFTELQKIKHAISAGRLWEHIEMRAYGHPSLLEALKKVSKYGELIEKQNPTTKKGGIFFFNSVGLARPEILRFKNHLKKRYSVPSEAKILLLMPQTKKKPFSTSKLHKYIRKVIQNNLGEKEALVHTCTYAVPFGVIPTELEEIYPLSQNVITYPFDCETKIYVSKQLSEFISTSSYKKVILLSDQQYWNDLIGKACAKACKKKQIPFFIEKLINPWTKNDLKNLVKIIEESLMQI